MRQTCARRKKVLVSTLVSEVAADSISRSWELYYRIRPQIETPENIGRLILLDLDSGDYEIADDELGFAATASVLQRHPDADVFCMRIGYMTAASFCGFMERIPT